ncbi:hypothetical protein NH26_19985 [Flammeovirga pacifica]|uniref:Uncharacterized protein n=1 Tax=Flammeovirga pacifica TaxID=915059 RepID=A0A1S1YS89_FLAPC|nr:hypothetical protein NH26_19985 [Flammeovirga pacifica]
MHYISFRIYSFIKKYQRQPQPKLANKIFLGTVPLSLLIWFNLLSIQSLISKYCVRVPIFKIEYVCLAALTLNLVIYFFVVNRRDFLRRYKKGFKGGVVVVLYIIFTLIMFIVA